MSADMSTDMSTDTSTMVPNYIASGFTSNECCDLQKSRSKRSGDCRESKQQLVKPGKAAPWQHIIRSDLKIVCQKTA